MNSLMAVVRCQPQAETGTDSNCHSPDDGGKNEGAELMRQNGKPTRRTFTRLTFAIGAVNNNGSILLFERMFDQPAGVDLVRILPLRTIIGGKPITTMTISTKQLWITLRRSGATRSSLCLQKSRLVRQDRAGCGPYCRPLFLHRIGCGDISRLAMITRITHSGNSRLLSLHATNCR
jgi:hypothetical protein